MSSDYGDFCREQRKYAQRKHHDDYRRNMQQIKDRLQDVPDLYMAELSNGHLRLRRRGVLVDFWPSTGTAMRCDTKEVRRGLSGNAVAKWIKKLSHRPTEPLE